MKTLIFDGADKLFDKGFSDQVSEICQFFHLVAQVVPFNTTLTKSG